MPEIREYSAPETEAQGPVGGVSPNIEASGIFGRSIQHVGEAMEQSGAILHRREAQQEISEIYSEFSQARAQWNEDLDKQVADGSLDTEKFQRNYQSYVDKMGKDVSTAEGKDFFNRQAARLGGALLTRASQKQVQLAGQQASAQMQTALNQDANTLYNDPTQFDDVYHAGIENIDAQVQANPKLAMHKDMLINKLGNEYAKAAIRGWTRTDPGSEEEGREGAAQKLLDSGELDRFLSPEDKAHMYQYAKQQARGADIEAMRQKKVLEDAQNVITEKWQNDNFIKIESGALSIKDINNSPLDAKHKFEAMRLVREGAKQELRTDPRLKNSLIQKILADDDDPNKIHDPDELNKHVGNGIGISDLNQLRSLFNKTPDGEILNSNRKALFNSASAAIRYRDPVTNQYSMDGEKRLGQFKNEVFQAEQAQRLAKKPIADLYNSASPDYLGNDARLSKYVTSPQERWQMSASAIKVSNQKAAVQDQGMVTVISPDGRSGLIPKANLDKAKKAGYKVKD